MRDKIGSLMYDHIELAHRFWKDFLEPTDNALDATCGNGHDTRYLAELLPQGKVIALDIQKAALDKTQGPKNVYLFQQCHSSFPPLAHEIPIKLIVYNLGYLPGGDKSLTTRVETTLQSISLALSLIRPDGALSITCYPGHPEGLKEKEALFDFLSHLDPSWLIHHYSRWRPLLSPIFIFIKKR